MPVYGVYPEGARIQAPTNSETQWHLNSFVLEHWQGLSAAGTFAMGC